MKLREIMPLIDKETGIWINVPYENIKLASSRKKSPILKRMIDPLKHDTSKYLDWDVIRIAYNFKGFHLIIEIEENNDETNRRN